MTSANNMLWTFIFAREDSVNGASSRAPNMFGVYVNPDKITNDS